MDDVIRILISNGGLSLNSGVCILNVIENTTYNTGHLNGASDTHSLIDGISHALPRTIAHFADKNLR